MPVLLTGVLVLFSCERPDESQKQPVSGGGIVLKFDSNDLSIEAEGEEDLILTVSPAEKTGQVEYIITDDEVVALSSADVDSGNGRITYKLKGVSLGTATFIASIGDNIAKCSISVDPVKVEKITLDKDVLNLEVGQSYSFNAQISPENASNPVIDWFSDDNGVATVSRGVVTGVSEGTTTVTASAGTAKVSCTVNVHAVAAESLELDIHSREIAVGETFIATATVLPDNATYRTASLSMSDESVASYELIDVVEGDNVIAARVTGLVAGTSVLKAVCGDLVAECEITVRPKEEPLKDPEIGDYFYSDGTWSDGASAPVEGKTVIGIVFSTDESRISKTEKAMGYTHGLVMAAKTAHNPDEVTTRYSFDSDFDVVPNKKTGVSWYADIEGYGWTQAILGAYPGEKLQLCPAFDWTTTDFSPSAPVNTSGWYVPSIGQLWDMLANLGGDEVAAHLRSLQTYSSDITYYYREGDLLLSYNPIDKMNSWLEAVPEKDRELFVTTMSRGSEGKVCDIMSSSLYDNTDGAVCIFWLYDSGQIEPVTDWTTQSVICRPVLSF